METACSATASAKRGKLAEPKLQGLLSVLPSLELDDFLKKNVDINLWTKILMPNLHLKLLKINH